MIHQEGGCLCRAVRYAVETDPLRVTICYCRFCQVATGSTGLVLPVFAPDAFAFVAGEPRIYTTPSWGSGKLMHVHFCPDCGSKMMLGLERFPDIVGVYAGTFDDPDWFPRDGDTAKHIFLGAAQHGTMIPPGVKTYQKHAYTDDGVPLEPRIFDEIHVIERR